jgi:hypothetical protein
MLIKGVKKRCSSNHDLCGVLFILALIPLAHLYGFGSLSSSPGPVLS